MATQNDSRFDEIFSFDRVFNFSRIVFHLVVLATVIPPLIFAVSISLRPASGWYQLSIIPSEITTEWYRQSISTMLPALINSYLRALGSAIIALLICVPSAYAFSREQFPGSRGSFFSIVGVQLFPPIIVVAPILVAYLALGLNDTIVGLWIVDMIFAIPLGVWLLHDFFNNLPVDLEDAAQVYGCSKFSAFIRVILPLAAPAMLAVGFLVFVRSWNEYLFAQLLTSSNAQVASILLAQDTSSMGIQNWGRIMAKAVIIAIPPTFLYLIARRSISSAFSVD